MAQRYRESSSRMASEGYPNPIDIHLGNAARLHQTTVPDVDELTRWLGDALDCTSCAIHSTSQFRGSPSQRPARQHELSQDKNSRRMDRDLSWVLIAYLVGVAALLSAAAYRLMS
jgi:hypothetical protein